MTIGVFTSTLQPMLKNDGSINAAGVLYFYEPGQVGSVAKVVYSDYLLTTSLGSTITLDSNARKVIYLNGDYDLVEKDSSGNTIVTRSNINPDQSTTVSDINLIANGSFETSTSNIPTGWTLSEWNAGANVVDSSAGNFAHGKYAMKFVSTGSGGGTLTTNSFFAVSNSNAYIVDFLLKSSDTNVRNVVQFLWYDKDQAPLGAPSTSVYDAASAAAGNSTSWTKYTKEVSPPADARWAKLKIIGCDSSDPTSGTSWYDGISVYQNPHQTTLIFAASTEVATAHTLQQESGIDIFHMPASGAFVLKGPGTGATYDRYKFNEVAGLVCYDASGAAATGGAQGAGSGNFRGVYDMGSRAYSSTSGSLSEYVGAISASSTNAHAHGLGSVPKLFQVRLRCVSASEGYSINDELEFGTKVVGLPTVSSSSGWCDATNFGVVLATELLIRNKSTFADVAVGSASWGNWNIVLRAWK